MSDDLTLPRGWMRSTLGDVLHIVRGVTYDKLESSKEPGDGRIPLLRATNIGERLDFDDLVYVPPKCVSEEQMLRRGDIVIAASSGSISVVGKAARLTDDWPGSFGAFCMGLRVNPVIESAYVAYFLGTSEYRRGVSQLAAGSNINNLRRTHIESFSFPLAPLPEQRRIVAKIEELFSDLDAGVAALERVRANLKRYRAAVLKAAVEGRLTEEWRKQHPATEPAAKLLERILAERRAKWEQEQLRKFKDAGKTPPKGWRERYEEPPRPKEVDASSLPSTWCWATVDQLIAGDRSSAYGVLQPGDDIPDGVPLVRVCDVADGRVAVDQLKRIAPEIAAQFARTVLRGGEVLLTIVGTIGRTAVAPESLRGANTARAVAVLPIGDAVPGRFVELMLRDSTARARLTLAAHEVARKTLNLEDVRIACIPVAPLAEQAEIVAEVDRRLSVAEAAEAQVEHALQRAARLRQAILKRAFEGKLVPQDPTDEPAAALLERVKVSASRPVEKTNARNRTTRRTKKATSAAGTARESRSGR